MGRRRKIKEDIPQACRSLDYLKINLLVTMGSRAGYMSAIGDIKLPEGSYGEDALAVFVNGKVEEYMNRGDDCDIGFDEFIETALMQKYGETE